MSARDLTFAFDPHPAGSLRERADLPTGWGGE
jgi:hypothetical protein